MLQNLRLYDDACIHDFLLSIGGEVDCFQASEVEG